MNDGLTDQFMEECVHEWTDECHNIDSLYNLCPQINEATPRTGPPKSKSMYILVCVNHITYN